jgi:hypothetical protein
MNTIPTIEITLFKIRPDVEETAFLEADVAFNEALKAMGGLIQRELLKGDNHQWVDIIHWENLAAAQHSANTIVQHPQASAFIQMLDTSDSKMLHLTSERSYP